LAASHLKLGILLLMKRLVVLFLFIILGFSAAQSMTKLVILPFDTSNSVSSYGLGIATALERSMNVIDTVFVAPVGDSLFYTQKQLSEGNVDLDKLASDFDASLIVSGKVDNQKTTDNTTLLFSGPAYPEAKQLVFSADLSKPAAAVAVIVEKIISELKLGLSAQERKELNAVIAQTPSTPSLGAVSESALGLPRSNLSDLETARDLDPNSSWVLSELARAQTISGDLSAAMQTSQQAVSIEPLDLDAQITSAVVLNSAGDNQKANEAFMAAYKINPNNPSVLVGLAKFEADPNKAQELLEKSISIYPRLVDAYLGLADLELASDPQKALTILRRGSSKVPGATSIHRRFLDIVVNSGDANGALNYIKEVLAKYPKPPVSVYNLATMLPFSVNKDAIQIVRDGRIQYPGNPILALSEAELLARAEDFQTAETVLQDALASHPGDTGLGAALATAQAKQGKINEAANTIYSVRGKTSEADFEIAQIYLEAGKASEATQLLGTLASQYPNSATILSLYGIALSRSGERERGLAQINQALAIDPNLAFAQRAKALLDEEQSVTGGRNVGLNPEAKVLYDQGFSAFQNANYEAAVDFFSRSRQIHDNGLSAFYQGLSEYHLDKKRAAAKSFKRALLDFPDSKIVLNNLGQTELELGRIDLAQDYLSKAIAIDSNYDQAHLNLGMVNFKLGKYAAAVSEWETAIRLNPENNSIIADYLQEAKSKQ